MNENLSTVKRSITGTTWLFLSSSFNTIAQLVVLGVLARLLSPKDFGVISVIMIFVNLSNIFTQMGIGSALVHLSHVSEKHISTAYTLSVGMGILIGSIFFFLGPILGSFFDIENFDRFIRFFSIFFIFNSFNSISIALLQRRLKFDDIAKTGVISYTFGYGLTSIALAFYGFGIWSLIIGQLSMLFLLAILLYFKEKPSFCFRYNLAIYKDLLYFGSGQTVTTYFNFIAENADNVIVGKMLGPTSLGLYSRAFQLFSLPATFFGRIYDQIFFPILSSKLEDTKKLISFYIFSISFCLIVLFPISILLLFNAGLLIEILLGDKWNAIVPSFKVLIIGFAFRFGTRINKSYLKSLGFIYKGALFQLFFLVSVILFCTVGGYYFNILGVAYGVLFATLLNYIQISYQLRKTLGFSAYYFCNLHLRTLIMLSPVLVMSSFLNYFTYNSNLVNISISLILYIPFMIYALSSRYSIVYDENNRIVLSQIYDNLPDWLKLRLYKFIMFFIKIRNYFSWQKI